MGVPRSNAILTPRNPLSGGFFSDFGLPPDRNIPSQQSPLLDFAEFQQAPIRVPNRFGLVSGQPAAPAKLVVPLSSSTKSSDRVTESVTKTDVMHAGATRQLAQQPQSSQASNASAEAITDQVTAIAARSSTQADFLKRLAGALLAELQAAVVVIAHPNWERPMVLTADQDTAQAFADRLEMDSISQRLSHATTLASACDIQLKSPATSPAPPENRTRGLHIQLMPQALSYSLLAVYGNHTIPEAAVQIRDLKRLAQYAACSRAALGSLPDKANADSISSATPTAAPPHSSARGWPTDRGRSLRCFHNDLDPTGTAYRIANETRRLLAADRVTVLLARRNRLQVEAVSGVAVVDRRANSVAATEAFVRRVIVLGRPITLPSQESLPPQIADPLMRYLDENDVASVTAIPLYRPADWQTQESNRFDTSISTASIYTDDQATDAQPIAVLLLESFADNRTAGVNSATQAIAAEAAVALANSIEHRRIFGLPLLKTLGDWFGGRKLPFSLIGSIAAIGLIAASLIIQVDHKIIATGYAEPSIQQNVFARTDGIVKEILVHDGQSISAGDLLLRLENADLETSAETLAGKIQTTSRRLAAIASTLLDPATDPKQATRMAIEQRQLSSELASLQGRLTLVRQQLSELEIRSPIDGVIAGWQLQRKLSNRPVGRGNHLLTVVRDDGPWQLRLEIADQDLAEIATARARDGKLAVQFAAASHPEATFTATLDDVATAARRNRQGVNVVDATASITLSDLNREQPGLKPIALSDARTGVEATAKITCGRRNLLGSWFGDVADFFHRNVLFYVR